MPPLHNVTLNGTTYVIYRRLNELRSVDDPQATLRFGSLADLQTYLFWTEQLQPVVGRRVRRAEMVFDESLDGWKPVLVFDDGQALEILQDEEGNGPGRFAYLA